MSHPSISQVVDALKLEPHLNGGFFKETHRDTDTLPHSALGGGFHSDADPRSLSTAILVLLPGNAISALHKVASDETYHFYLGTTSITLVEFDLASKQVCKTRMGHDIVKGEKVQHTIKKGTVWGTLPNTSSPDDYALFGATVAPGFDFRDFSSVDSAELIAQFPEHEEDILRLTHKTSEKVGGEFSMVPDEHAADSLIADVSASLESVKLAEPTAGIKLRLGSEQKTILRATVDEYSTTYARTEPLVSIENVPISMKEINLFLGSSQWLNDECINGYLGLLKSRYPRTFFHSTFFFSRLMRDGSYDYSSVRRWSKKVDLLRFDHIVVPINKNNFHWSCAHINVRDGFVAHYDSMGSGLSDSVTETLQRYIQDEYRDKAEKFERDPQLQFEWKSPPQVIVPRQQDGSSCGVFTCLFAHHIAADSNFSFGHSDIFPFRQTLAYSLIFTKLD